MIFYQVYPPDHLPLNSRQVAGGGSYRKPNEELFRRESKMGPKEWERQVKEMEQMVKVVEGEDDRSYGPVVDDKKSK